jgi:hypothetical protein
MANSMSELAELCKPRPASRDTGALVHSDSSGIKTMRLVSAMILAALAAALLIAEPAQALGIRSRKSGAVSKHAAKAHRATVDLSSAADLMVMTVSCSFVAEVCFARPTDAALSKRRKAVNHMWL